MFRSKAIQKKYSDRLVLVDGSSKDDIALAMSYGFKKVISLKELIALYPNIDTVTGNDICKPKNRSKIVQNLLKRFGMTEVEFKESL